MRMPKILCILIFCLSAFGFSQNVQEIIAKVENNQAKIKDLSADVEIETSIQWRAEPLIQTIKIWQAKDEKGNTITRTEFMIQDTGYTMQDKKVIMIMTKDSVFTKRGKEGVKRVKRGEEGTEFQMTHERFFESMKEARILNQEGDIAVLELIPKETEGIKIFDKAEIVVDTGRGVITNQKLFTPMGVIRTEMKYEKLEVGSEKLEVLKEMKTITQYGITRMRYKNIKVNKGIDKRKFEL